MDIQQKRKPYPFSDTASFFSIYKSLNGGIFRLSRQRSFLSATLPT